MNFKNKSSLTSLGALLFVGAALVACQPRNAKNAGNDGPFQCISTTIMVAGKPTTTVLEWNTKTGMARILDSMVVTSKATGAQNFVIGWVPLGDLQGALQEIVARNQTMQQPAPAASQEAAESASASSKKKK